MNINRPLRQLSFWPTFQIAALLTVATIHGASLGDGGIFLSPERIDAIKERVRLRQEPTYGAFEKLQADADQALTAEANAPKVWYVPRFYADAQGHKDAKLGLRDDANSAYALALMYQITGNAEYGKGAARYLDSWVETVEETSAKDDSKLSFSYHFPPFIFAADLIDDSESIWPKSNQEAFREFLRNKAIPMNTMERQNNWGNWGVTMTMAAAVYLRDQDLFDQTAERWKALTRDQIADDGHMRHEVSRQEGGDRGIWYSHFSLMPQTISAEIARLQNIDLYDYRSPEGRSLQLAFETLTPWAHHPETFPYYKGDDPSKQHATDYVSYWEILNARWPNEDATAMLEGMRPLTAEHSAPYLTLTHGLFPADL